MYKLQKITTHVARNLRAVYPFCEMVAGDSFFVPLNDKRSASVGSSARAYGKRNGVVFKTRKTEMDGVLGILVYIDYDQHIQPPVINASIDANTKDDNNGYF